MDSEESRDSNERRPARSVRGSWDRPESRGTDRALAYAVLALIAFMAGYYAYQAAVAVRLLLRISIANKTLFRHIVADLRGLQDAGERALDAAISSIMPAEEGDA